MACLWPNAASMNLKRGSGWRCSWPLSCAVFPPSSSPGRSTAFRPSIRPRTPSKACGFRAGPSRLRERISVRCGGAAARRAQSLLDVWPRRAPCRSETRRALTLTGQLTFTMLTQGGELGLDSASQTVTISAALPQKGEGCELLPEVTVLSASGTIAQGRGAALSGAAGHWPFDRIHKLQPAHRPHAVDEEHPAPLTARSG